MAGVFSTASGAAPVADADHFEKRIRPLLLEHCTECHGEKKQKGSLRLDFKGGWEKGGDSGPAIAPGKLDESLLWKAVSYTDRDLKMPPKKKLSESDLEALRTWIAAGAVDPRDAPPGAAAGSTHGPKIDGNFWSFQPPVDHPAPAVKHDAWPASDIDRFVLAKQEAAGLRPAPEADARTLVRRLTFDLTGLPPTEEMLKDAQRLTATGGLEVFVDSLLASPAFAERWASHWLDMTRFAESSGGGRSLPFKDAWRFRDYILESIRDNVPVDRMIVEMIAGDLLPFDSAAERRRQLTATGFLALGPTNYEEQDKGMLRMDIVDEQLDTLGKSFLGMTIGCARCHDHKFDPISTRDYYAMAGIMRSTQTLKNYTDNVAHWIDAPLPLDGEKETLLQAQEKQAAALKTQIAELKDQLRDAGGAELRSRKAIKPGDLPGLVVDDAEAMKVGEWKVSTNYGPFIGDSYVHDLNEGKGEKTVTFNARPKKTGRYEVRLAYIAGAGRAERIPVTILHADGEELIYMKQATEAARGLQFASLGTFRFEADGQGYVLISNAGAEGYVTVDAVQFLPVDADALANSSPAADSKSKTIGAQISALSKELKELEKNGLTRPEAMSVADDTAPEDARVHIRGNIRNLGAPVPRGFIQVLMKQEAPKIPANQSGRLQLAEWITSRDNPLTARVLVNRVWHWLFGAGLVRSTDNFGSTGELPSHPELLDALAIRFMEDDWDLKRLVKAMVLSRTYRQSSGASSPQADPDNRLLTHMNRRRLDAECIRDAMLAAAGTLDDRFGGPNVGGAGAVDSNDTKVQNLEYGYTFPDTRRSVYTAAFRNVRHPLFEVFDFADINQPLLQRTTSTVATQALFMMNHPFIITQARAAADKVLAEVANDEQRLPTVYLRSLGRWPTPEEADVSRDFLEASISGNAAPEDIRDTWARLIQTLWATPDFRFLR